MLSILLASEARVIFQDILVFALCMMALFWGSNPERAAIAIWLFCLELPNFIYKDWLGFHYNLSGVDIFLATKDILAGILWIALALYANRNYTLWIAGVQLLAMVSHVSKGLVESIAPIAYAFLVVAPGWIVLLIMAIGFTRHIRRQKKFGKYRDWRVTPRQLRDPRFRPDKLA